MQRPITTSCPITKLPKTFFSNTDLLRLDAMEPVGVGNKLFKLKYHLEHAKKHHRHVVSFGGAFSNHLHALAMACASEGIPCTCFVRAYHGYSHTLEAIRESGATIRELSRSKYRQKNDKRLVEEWVRDIANPYVIPEGGGGERGFLGACEIASCIPSGYDYWVLPTGTGITLAALADRTPNGVKVFGFGAVQDSSLPDAIRKHTEKPFGLTFAFSEGGPGKQSDACGAFQARFEAETQILLDPVYTAKMLYGLAAMQNEGLFAGKRVLAIHTGGLQGRRLAL